MEAFVDCCPGRSSDDSLPAHLTPMTRVLPPDLCQPLVDRIKTFVDSCDPLRPDGPYDREVDRLIADVFKLQVEHDPGYRQLCQARGISADEGPSWDRIPMVPTAAFKSPSDESEIEGALTFRSSGTTLGEGTRSLHVNPFPELYRSIIDAGYEAYCLSPFAEPPICGRPPTLSLIPARSQVADSSLGFMADHILQEHAATDSVVAFTSSGVDLDAAIAFPREERQTDQRPSMVLTTAFALVELLDYLAHRSSETGGTRLQLPPVAPRSSKREASRAEPGRSSRSELIAQAGSLLGVPPRVDRTRVRHDRAHQPALLRRLFSGAIQISWSPHPGSGRGFSTQQLSNLRTEAHEGLIGFFDLGNVGTYPAVLTEDLGTMHEHGLELLGRASLAELRGCSLTVEELQIAAGKAAS